MAGTIMLSGSGLVGMSTQHAQLEVLACDGNIPCLLRNDLSGGFLYRC